MGVSKWYIMIPSVSIEHNKSKYNQLNSNVALTTPIWAIFGAKS